MTGSAIPRLTLVLFQLQHSSSGAAVSATGPGDVQASGSSDAQAGQAQGDQTQKDCDVVEVDDGSRRPVRGARRRAVCLNRQMRRSRGVQ